jgi:hypothetical protein
MTGNGVERQAPEDCGRRHTSGSTRQTDLDNAGLDGFGPPHPLSGIFAQVRELVSYANLYFETRKDLVRSAVRRAIWMAALAAVGALAGATIVIMSAAYLISGIAHGLGTLFGHEYWLGELVTGVAVLLILGIGAFFAIKSLKRKSRERTIEKYERRQQQQREQFGHSATERAQQVRTAHRS